MCFIKAELFRILRWQQVGRLKCSDGIDLIFEYLLTPDIPGEMSQFYSFNFEDPIRYIYNLV